MNSCRNYSALRLTATALPLAIACLFILSVCNPATCFYAKRSSVIQGRSRTRHHSHEEASPTIINPTTTISISDGITEWEDQIRHEATDALLPVLFPKISHGSSSSTNNSTSSEDPSSSGQEQKPISAEVALKRLLRKKYQHRNNKCDSSESNNQPHQQKNNTKEEANEIRGRLAALILGTSVMRLRHYYDAIIMTSDNENEMLRMQQQQWCSSTYLPIPYPLDSSLCSLMFEGNNFTDTGSGSGSGSGSTGETSNLELLPSDNRIHSSEERLLVRAMIDRHATHLSSTDDDENPTLLPLTSTTLQTKSRNNNSTTTTIILQLSIQYSLPTFLTSSLLSHYGYAKTKQICSLMNTRGPITIRRNAIQFPGSSEELCKWLWDEDGVRGEPLSTLLEGGGQSNGGHRHNNMHGDNNDDVQYCQSIELNSPPDGRKNFIMGSLSNAGSVIPSEGSIQIIPPLAKSIWSMKGWQNGYFEVQDAGSQLIVQSLEAAPGETILDYCAGNGGKTFALASAVMNTASRLTNSDDVTDATVHHSRVVAHDVVQERLRQIKGSLPRVGFVVQEGNNTHNNGITAQSTRANRQCTIQTSSNLDTTHASAPFDAVLVDAPCSSTGVLRRRPSQRWDLTEKQVFEELPELQLEILEKAATFVNENGGKLVYSTCSLLPEENESVVEKFERSSAFRQLGFERWEFVSTSINDRVGRHDHGGDGVQSKDSHMLTLLPSETASDGFFIARWKRGTEA